MPATELVGFNNKDGIKYRKMDDKIEVRARISYKYIPSSGKYQFMVSAGIPADDEGYLPEVLRDKYFDFFEQLMTKTWGELRNGILHAHYTKEFSSIDEGERWANNYVQLEIGRLRHLARSNRTKMRLSQSKGKGIDVDI